MLLEKYAFEQTMVLTKKVSKWRILPMESVKISFYGFVRIYMSSWFYGLLCFLWIYMSVRKKRTSDSASKNTLVKKGPKIDATTVNIYRFLRNAGSQI